ncbi:MAG TPA: DUF5667 domain-containing protein [Candidatus Portnoybacteria bacterium]|jgi:hypothetical protein|nr:DUF5667 domain-containing protein [Candidatus Portnoybacteria bacterium]MDD5752030.1 DUF5667 domain-containing protein [Candidatus Portnoybacteria bacterium]HNU96729.1 DUF5667 domain-containing protein [Candidatus Portnoybacteria bacterium]HOZ16380.1 DUF5667 domain-containing protein [Candidatus Portnoybacteria bacterium]HPH52070.1 DUF5667 domain-containing protein [Candidatus Portnoybacteria bacterium]
MKKIIVFIVLLGFIIGTNHVFASFSDNIKPDSKLYFLKIWWEKIVLFFTFDAAKRAEKYQLYAEEKAKQAEKMVVDGKPAIAEKLKNIYETYLNKAKDILNKAIQKAVEKGKEEMKQRLEKMIEDLMNKIKESIKL